MLRLRKIASQYLKTDNMTIVSQLFDDENIHEFIGIVKEIIGSEKKSGNKVVVDVISAEWNYIPASLMLLAEENRKIIRTVLYHHLRPRYAAVIRCDPALCRS